MAAGRADMGAAQRAAQRAGPGADAGTHAGAYARSDWTMQLCKHPCGRIDVPFCSLQHVLHPGERAFQLWLQISFDAHFTAVIKAKAQKQIALSVGSLTACNDYMTYPGTKTDTLPLRGRCLPKDAWTQGSEQHASR